MFPQGDCKMHTKLILTASIALALAGNCFAAVKDGSYTTTVTGHNAPLTVTVDIKNGKISDISVKDLESPGVGKVAIKQLSAEIKDHQTTKPAHKATNSINRSLPQINLLSKTMPTLLLSVAAERDLPVQFLLCRTVQASSLLKNSVSWAVPRTSAAVP